VRIPFERELVAFDPGLRSRLIVQTESRHAADYRCVGRDGIPLVTSPADAEPEVTRRQPTPRSEITRLGVPLARRVAPVEVALEIFVERRGVDERSLARSSERALKESGLVRA
jgi:hypothetical protein